MSKQLRRLTLCQDQTCASGVYNKPIQRKCTSRILWHDTSQLFEADTGHVKVNTINLYFVFLKRCMMILYGWGLYPCSWIPTVLTEFSFNPHTPEAADQALQALRKYTGKCAEADCK